MENKELPAHIQTVWLNRIYWIVPVMAAVVAVDSVMLGGSLLPYMGLESLLLPLYLLIFELPHIVGSFLSFADREYIQHYHKQLFIGLPIILVLIGSLLYWNLTMAIVLYLVATMYHVIKQQTGISILLGAARGLLHKVWTWSGIVTTSLLFVYFLLPGLFPAVVLGPMNYAFLLLTVLFVVAGMIVWKQTQSAAARSYVAWTTALLFGGYVFILFGYLFLAFFMIRFVHDITAFYFYIVHETNRNAEYTHNVLYRILKIIPLPVYVLVPVLSILIAYLLRSSITDVSMVYTLVILFGFAHYYLESLIWKRDALHRSAIRVSRV